MKCPIDHSTLVTTQFGGRNLHRCNHCFRSFVTADIFSEVRAASAIQLHSLNQGVHLEALRGDGKTLYSPCHEERMRAIFFRGVEIDVCPVCKGIWLDQGELQKISDLVQVTKHEDLSGIPQEKARIVGGSNSGGSFDVFPNLIEFISSIGEFID